MSNLAKALAHAQAGRPVFPCRRVASGKRTAKSPLTKRGFLDASTDAIQVTEWFSRWPDALIGLRTGAKFWVLDIDPVGTPWMEEHRDALGARRIQTTARGFHLYFLADPRIGIKTGRLPKGIDIRGVGGYCLDWSAEGLPCHGSSLDALGVAPNWLLEMILDEPATRDAPSIERKRRTLADQLSTIQAASPGYHDALRDISAKLIAGGLQPHTTKDLLLALAGDDRTERAADRIDSIDRLVDSAVEKFGKPKPPQFVPGLRQGATLMSLDIPPVKWAVRDLVGHGLTLLVASPKIGKSWLALQIGLAIVSGHEVLGKPTERGSVLMLALEDGDRRMQSRLFKLAADLLPESDLNRIHFSYDWPRVDQGGIEHLETWLKTNPDARLVVVDVLEKIRPPRTARGNSYGEDYEALRRLKMVADAYQVAILVIHHTRKSTADDILEMISGTQGLAGAADAALILKRPRGEERGELHVTGRDLPNEGKYAIRFERATCRWSLLGDAEKVPASPERHEILEFLRRQMSPVTPAEVTLAVGRSRTSVMNSLARLVASGAIEKSARGKYTAIPVFDDHSEKTE